jgi:transposase-like protein
MPWKECSVMDERLRFVARLLDGEAMTIVCREFGISRKTAYKIFDRYKEHGLQARLILGANLHSILQAVSWKRRQQRFGSLKPGVAARLVNSRSASTLRLRRGIAAWRARIERLPEYLAMGQ